jgi:hypothetical protein
MPNMKGTDLPETGQGKGYPGRGPCFFFFSLLGREGTDSLTLGIAKVNALGSTE